VVGFGEAGCPHPEGTRRLPEIFFYLVIVVGKAGNNHQIRMILGGLAALQTSRLAGGRVTRVIFKCLLPAKWATTTRVVIN
jgi:hypothetical protein